MKYTYLLFALLLSVVTFSQNFTISGVVKDADTGEVLIGANIYVQESLHGTNSNNYGFFSLTLPSDSVNLICSYVGYVQKEMIIVLRNNTEVQIGLTANVLDEVIVTESKYREPAEVGMIKVPIKTIQSMPALMGETDVIKVLQLLPGVQSGAEGFSGMYVRGGSADQNLYLLDGVPIYNPTHLLGAFSSFNPEAINSIELTKGGFPARYGGRLSSVVDVHLKDGNKNKLKYSGSIGLISSRFTVDGPVKSDKTTFLITGRRVYLDLITRPIFYFSSKGESNMSYAFYDLNGKISHRFSNKDRVSFYAYDGLDKGAQYSKRTNKTTYIDNYEMQAFGGLWGNRISSIKWNHVFSPKLFMSATTFYNRYKFEMFNQNEEKRVYPTSVEHTDVKANYSSGVNEFSVKTDFEWQPNNTNKLRFGAQATRHRYNPGTNSITSNVDSDTVFGFEPVYATETATYFENEMKIKKFLNTNLGIHYSTFLVNGKIYHSFQPRIAATYIVNDKTLLKASFSEMTQFTHLLSTGSIGMPIDLWMPATENIEPQRSRQLSLGMEKSINTMFEMNIGSYFKKLYNLVEFKHGLAFMNLNTDLMQSVATKGTGTSYGFELFLQKKTGKFTGWTGYTYSKSTRTFSDLNYGKPFPFKYDRRHDISITGVYKLNEKTDISGSWVFGSGNPITLPLSYYARYNGGNETSSENYQNIQYYSDRNSYRMKPYHRLDLGISFKKQKKWGERTWTVSVYNAYNRNNTFFVEAKDYLGSKEFVENSVFPIIPSVSYSFKFRGRE